MATGEEQENSAAFIRKVLSATQQIKLDTYLNVEPAYSNETINLFDAPSLICFKVNEVVNHFYWGKYRFGHRTYPPRN